MVTKSPQLSTNYYVDIKLKITKNIIHCTYCNCIPRLGVAACLLAVMVCLFGHEVTSKIFFQLALMKFTYNNLV